MQPGNLVVMGVSGCGKSTVARALAERLDRDVLDADDFHPASNVAKMSAGIPLDDNDRKPWLAALSKRLHEQIACGEPIVLACSALKEAYRVKLRSGDKALRFIYLRGTYEEVMRLLHRRKNHFMKPELLRSQFDALEEPADALVIPVSLPVEEQVARIVAELAK